MRRLGSQGFARILSGIALIAAFAKASSATDVQIELIAQSGAPAPGAPAGSTFATFSLNQTKLTIARNGNIAFKANLVGPGIDPARPTAFFGPDGQGGIRMLARLTEVGEPSGDTFFQLLHIVLTDLGDVAFTGGVDGPTTNARSGVWRVIEGGEPELVVLEGQIDPFTGLRFGRFFRAVYSGDGNLAVQSHGGAAIHVTGVYRGIPGSLVPVVSNGDVIEGVTVEVIQAPRIAAGGDIAVHVSELIGPSMLLTWNPVAGLAMMARTGDQAPGTIAGVLYESLSLPVLNGGGDVSFHANLMGGDAFLPRDEALFARRDGVVALVAREGQPAPGTPTGVVFRDRNYVTPQNAFPGWNWINDAGDVSFLAGLAGPGVTVDVDTGLWATHAGTVELRVLEGTELPEQPGVFLDGLRSPTLDAAGNLTFVSTLRGAGVTTANDRGLFRVSPAQELITMIREGDVVSVGGNLRTIASLLTLEPTNGDEFEGCCSRAVNDDGQAAVLVTFSGGGTGIFRLSVIVPEVPGIGWFGAAFTGAAIAAWGVLRGRRGAFKRGSGTDYLAL